MSVEHLEKLKTGPSVPLRGKQNPPVSRIMVNGHTGYNVYSSVRYSARKNPRKKVH